MNRNPEKNKESSLSIYFFPGFDFQSGALKEARSESFVRFNIQARFQFIFFRVSIFKAEL